MRPRRSPRHHLGSLLHKLPSPKPVNVSTSSKTNDRSKRTPKEKDHNKPQQKDHNKIPLSPHHEIHLCKRKRRGRKSREVSMEAKVDQHAVDRSPHHEIHLCKRKRRGRKSRVESMEAKVDQHVVEMNDMATATKERQKQAQQPITLLKQIKANEKCKSLEIGKRPAEKQRRHGTLTFTLNRDDPPPNFSITLYSKAVKIAGLNWRLRIVLNRNSVLSQSRFLSIFVICEDLLAPETLTAFLTIRILSQVDGSKGYEQEIIGHFDSTHHSVGVSSFISLHQLFGADSEYIDKVNGEVAIETDVKVKNRITFCSRYQRQLTRNSADLHEEDKENKKVGAVHRMRQTKINEYMPSRRSCRISPKFLDDLRIELLREKVGKAANEPFLEIVHCPVKGRGLRTTTAFNKGDFVVEYKGDVIGSQLARKRERRYSRKSHIGCYMFYFKHKEQRYCIDATAETQHKGRLVNHSRLAPNLKAKVFDLGNTYPHLCLVALREISPGEELRFDYGDRTPLTVEKHPWLVNS